MTNEQAQEAAERIVGAKAIAEDRGDQADPSSRYLVGPDGYWNDRHALVGTGSTWQAAFADLWMRRVIVALDRYRFTAHDEKGLYGGIETALTDAGIPYHREHVLTGRERVDLYLGDARVAIEVKVQGNHHAVLRQLERYAKHPTVDGILLVTTLARLARIPDRIAEKPARALRLAGAFG